MTLKTEYQCRLTAALLENGQTCMICTSSDALADHIRTRLAEMVGDQLMQGVAIVSTENKPYGGLDITKIEEDEVL